MTTPKYTLTVLGDVDSGKDEETSWLWPGIIPASAAGMFDGDPGLGKSMVTMDLAARVTTGAKWPDGQKGIRPADILVIAAEDTRATLLKRLRAHGADLKRCVTLDDVEGDPVKLPRHIPIIENIVRDRKVKLVVIDPIMAFLEVTAMSDQKVREALTPLKALAERTGTTIIFVRHLTKEGGKNAKHAGSGSMGILGACRFGYIFGEDPDDKSKRVMAVTKFNLAKEPASMGYQIVDPGKVAWHQGDDGLTVKWSANDVLRNRQVSTEAKEERDEVIEFLEDYMRNNGFICSPNDLFADAKFAGITPKMLRTAKAKMGVRSRKLGISWFWVHPNYGKKTTLRAV